ncbi:hypothetical protein EDD86DRAFT_59788 [Gorgonomyces haynaldii]|nr:hypothetical protein EDD86DRAFT_59788 [Gorgonomyces haynaldii]
MNLPIDVLDLVCERLDALSLLKLSNTCKQLSAVCRQDIFWKELCLNDFPWFFWQGSCERTLLVYLKDGRKPVEPTEPIHKPSVHNLDWRLGPVYDGDLGVPCLGCRKKGKNPYHPLPDNWFQAYISIISGRYTGYLQVLNSLQDRHMSAFNALVNVDFKNRRYVVCYDARVISIYRQKRPINLLENPDLIAESFPLIERTMFRRIPLDLLDWDPRELNYRWLFNQPTQNGRPLIEQWQEVEIQWRMVPSNPWSWWRGHVGDVFAIPDQRLIELTPGNEHQTPNQSMLTEDIGNIQITHEQFDPASPWFSTFVSTDGS